MSEGNKTVLYLDLPTFIHDCASKVSAKTPMIIEPKQWKRRWGVEVSVTVNGIRNVAVRFATDQAQAHALAEEMRTRFRKTLHHVA